MRNLNEREAEKKCGGVDAAAGSNCSLGSCEKYLHDTQDVGFLLLDELEQTNW